MQKKNSSTTYKKSGVDIKKADKLISDLTPLIRSTHNSSILKNIGGFSSIFDFKKLGYLDPLIMCTTDGVGTKLQLAIKTKNFFNIGIDLVAMCVNDIIAQGGTSHFFMDYIATGKLKVNVTSAVIKGIVEGCKLANCALVGGETAEMPGHYDQENFDLAGFCVGAAERNEIFNINDVKKNNVIIAIESSGFHSNGYSLLRKVIEDKSIKLYKKAPFNKNKSFEEILLKPTNIYCKLIKKLKSNVRINGITHITGGGLIDNPPRSFSDNLSVTLNMNSYEIDPMFHWIKETANLSWKELLNTFNCGVGLLIYLDKDEVDKAMLEISNFGYKNWIIGDVTIKKNKKVNFMGL